jgi:hypothetical protein
MTSFKRYLVLALTALPCVVLDVFGNGDPMHAWVELYQGRIIPRFDRKLANDLTRLAALRADLIARGPRV